MSRKYQATRNFVILLIINLIASLGWIAVSNAQQSSNGFDYALYMPLIKAAIATPTPTPTVPPGCQIDGASLSVFNNQLTFPITNKSSQTYKIQSISLSWPDTGTQALTAIDVQGNVIWDGPQVDTSPFNSSGPWSPDRVIPPNSSRLISFTFLENLPEISYTVQITFTNGCTISASKPN